MKPVLCRAGRDFTDIKRPAGNDTDLKKKKKKKKTTTTQTERGDKRKQNGNSRYFKKIIIITSLTGICLLIEDCSLIIQPVLRKR